MQGTPILGINLLHLIVPSLLTCVHFDVNVYLHLLADPGDYHPGLGARLAEPVQERRREAELHDELFSLLEAEEFPERVGS